MKYTGEMFKATPGSAGYDLKAAETTTIPPRQVRLVPLSATVALPPHTAGLLAARSSLHKKGLMLANGVGIIDSDYRDRLMAALLNFSDSAVTINEGDRIAQLVPLMLYTEEPTTPDKELFRQLYLKYDGPKDEFEDEWRHLLDTYGVDVATLFEKYKEMEADGERRCTTLEVDGMELSRYHKISKSPILRTSLKAWIADVMSEVQQPNKRKGGFGSTGQ